MLTCDDYLSPGTLDEAFDAIDANRGRYRIVAGATDILPWAREGRAGDVHIPVLIDVTGIPDLQAFGSTDMGRIYVGAATPFQRFLDVPELAAALPVMPRMAVWFADDQIRESATMGGNLINASPAADGTPALLTFDTAVHIARRENGKIRRNSMWLEDFVLGPGQTELAEDEILIGVECEAKPLCGGAFEKVGHRRSLVISTVCLAALVKMGEKGRRLTEVRLAVGGIGPVPVRLYDVESYLLAGAIGAKRLEEAAEIPLDLIQSRTRQEYRREVLRGFVLRGLINAVRNSGASLPLISREFEAAHA